MKSLNGKELAGFIKEKQAYLVRGLAKKPKLLIIYDNDSPVIKKYVDLKKRYGEDIGVSVLEEYLENTDEIVARIKAANEDDEISGIILQLPILEKEKTDELVDLIAPEKDVDGLGKNARYDSATATAINWLLAGYGIELENKAIAIVGRGRLVGAPLYRMWTNSDYEVSLFHRGSDLTKLKNFDIIVSATGVPGLISGEFIKPGAVLVDAGTASEKGILKGDFSDDLRNRNDLSAITPVFGGVGPLTVACLFDHVIQAGS